MSYVGLQQQINRNNFRSTLLLIAFPAVIIAAVYGVTYFMYMDVRAANYLTVRYLPFVLGAVGIWFLIAWWGHSSMIKLATRSHTLERKDNMRVYNLVENLCMSKGMKMPKVNIIESDALNAFASGLNEKTYTVTLTRGIIDKLNDDELEGVIAHELMHIRNKDVRLLIISIIFVGILAFAVQIAFRSMLWGGSNRKKQDGRLMIIILIVSLVAYLLTILFKFALSRKREYLADAGAAEMTKKPLALASALRKISGRSEIENVKGDVKEMFISNESKGLFGGGGSLFATHPPIEKRIQVLEQF